MVNADMFLRWSQVDLLAVYKDKRKKLRMGAEFGLRNLNNGAVMY